MFCPWHFLVPHVLECNVHTQATLRSHTTRAPPVSVLFLHGCSGFGSEATAVVSYGPGSTVDNGTFEILKDDGRIKKPNVLNVLEDEHLERGGAAVSPICGPEQHPGG